jgi:hypothetical protein
MQMNGTRTTHETITVDIDPREFLTKIYQRLIPSDMMEYDFTASPAELYK